MDKETVLITGATGFIGSHVTKEVVATGKYKVVAIVRETKDYKNTDELSRNGVQLIKGLFYDSQVLWALFHDQRISHVIHLAALRGTGLAEEREYQIVNVDGTERLLEYALIHGVEKFVFCSTVGVFGTIPAEVPAGPNTPLAGDNPYHRSKVLAEEKVLSYSEKGLDGYIIRPTIVYGNGNHGFPDRLIMMVKGHQLLLPTRDIKFHLLYVKGVSDVIKRVLEVDNLEKKVLVVADKEPVSLYELVNLIHMFYYNKKYPNIFRVPSYVYRLTAIFFRLIGNEKWKSRASWLCKDWYYDIADTCKTVNYIPFDTRSEFTKYLRCRGEMSQDYRGLKPL